MVAQEKAKTVSGIVRMSVTSGISAIEELGGNILGRPKGVRRMERTICNRI